MLSVSYAIVYITHCLNYYSSKSSTISFKWKDNNSLSEGIFNYILDECNYMHSSYKLTGN